MHFHSNPKPNLRQSRENYISVVSLNLYMFLQDVLKSTRAQLERELLMDDVLRIEDMPSFSLLSWMASNKEAGSRSTVLFIWLIIFHMILELYNLSRLYLLNDTWHLPLGWFHHSNHTLLTAQSAPIFISYWNRPQRSSCPLVKIVYIWGLADFVLKSWRQETRCLTTFANCNEFFIKLAKY